ncbi:trimeric intracellular cation channel family protein [Corynebacterium doosanense]|uniref:Membrane protein n=1 Tax=Corynebacterium doosanense CAU 212 = DSM 45436 TaxID=558173 RepID=A0A097IHD6_9CORY|nr:trimeric intracellular cation channel family protein [Corynebacterium doosanense]AIT61545.1 membrane protein [Corynebacterium doosanense CAU 212 = DSM 45436]
MNVEGVDPQILLMYRVSDVSGVLLMGVIGGTIARQRGFDIVGFLFIALFSALGGGMIRDVLINQGTVAAMATPEYLLLAFMGSLIARFVYFKGRAWEQVQVHGDAIVSGLWAATGCVKALSFGLPFLSCVMMGVFTAVGGGMIRDVVTGRIPGVFGNNTPTVIPAVAVTLVVLGCNAFDLLAYGMVLGPLLGIALTLYGYWAGWRIDTDSEWAPVNRAVSKAERESRKVAREIEPRRVRAWRHRQMEKALERRQRKNPVLDDQSPEEMMDALTSEFEQVQEEESSGFGMDLGGGSYDYYDADAAETTGDGRTTDEILNKVLADDDLMDELLDRLERKGRGATES